MAKAAKVWLDEDMHKQSKHYDSTTVIGIYLNNFSGKNSYIVEINLFAKTIIEVLEVF